MTLRWTVIETDEQNLWRQPVLLHGATDALLIDGGFTLSAGHRIVEAIRASGTRLRQIVVTCHDPDYYFSLGVVKAAFPDVGVVAPPAIADMIARTAQHKIEVWRERLGDDGPVALAQLALPAPLGTGQLALEGVPIEVVAARQPLNYHLWLAQQRVILGGVQISGANHVWMADTPTIAERVDWLADLETMLERDPRAAPAGHAPPQSPTGIAAIRGTREYIRAFDKEQARAGSADELIAAMRRHYPGLGMDFILELGARVCLGEQQWP